MARVLIATQPWGVVQDTLGNARAGVTLILQNLDASPATVFAGSTGGATVTPTTNIRGEAAGFIEEGTYNSVDSNGTKQIEAVSGSRVLYGVAAAAGGTDRDIYVDTDDGAGSLWQNQGGAWVRIAPPVNHASRHQLAGADPLSLVQYDRANGQAGMLNLGPGSTVASSGLTAGTWRTSRFVPSRNMTVLSVAFPVVTAAANADQIDIAILSGAGAVLWKTGMISAFTVGVNLTSTGVKSVSIGGGGLALLANTIYYAGIWANTPAGAAAALGTVSYSQAFNSVLFGTGWGPTEVQAATSGTPATGFPAVGVVPANGSSSGTGFLVALREF